MLQGLVIETQRRHNVVQMPDGTRIKCISKGRLLQMACGDLVNLTMTEAEAPGYITADRCST